MMEKREKVILVILLLCCPVSLQAQRWRTAYYENYYKTVEPISAIPWSKYTHVIQCCVAPGPYGAPGDGSVDLWQLNPTDIAAFVAAAHAAGKKALVGVMDEDNDYTLLRDC